MKEIFGYCAVTADCLHIGHIRFIEACRKKCKHLTVGIMSDECVREYKGKYPLMNQFQRSQIVSSLKMVDAVLIQNSFEFPEDIVKTYKIFDAEEHQRKGADSLIPRTGGISSTIIKEQDDYFNPGKLPL